MKKAILASALFIFVAGCATVSSTVSSRAQLAGVWRNEDSKLTLRLLPNGTFRESTIYQTNVGSWSTKGDKLIMVVEDVSVSVGSGTLKPPYTKKLSILEKTDSTLKLQTNAGRRLSLTLSRP